MNHTNWGCDQEWYTKWKDNRPIYSNPIEWEEFKETFLEKYFHRERREVKVEEFINLKQGSMSVYSFKYTMFSRYVPSLVSNPTDENSRSVTGVADLVKKECRTTILQNDMSLSRIMVYAHSIEDSKFSRKEFEEE